MNWMVEKKSTETEHVISNSNLAKYVVVCYFVAVLQFYTIASIHYPFVLHFNMPFVRLLSENKAKRKKYHQNEHLFVCCNLKVWWILVSCISVFLCFCRSKWRCIRRRHACKISIFVVHFHSVSS